MKNVDENIYHFINLIRNLKELKNANVKYDNQIVKLIHIRNVLILHVILFEINLLTSFYEYKNIFHYNYRSYKNKKCVGYSVSGLFISIHKLFENNIYMIFKASDLLTLLY